jgi:hypothetical protein
MRNIFIGLLAVCLLPACQPGTKTETAFYQWLHDPSNGLVQTRQIGDLQLSVKYLPAELLAYREHRGTDYSPQQTDSLRNRYRQSHAFLLTIKPIGPVSEGKDVMYRGVGSYGAYKRRVMDLNFNLDQYVRLKDGAKEVKPLLHTLENTYGATEGRSLYLVFENAAASGTTLDFVFSDEILGTGISHFRFRKSDLENVPQIRPDHTL